VRRAGIRPLWPSGSLSESVASRCPRRRSGGAAGLRMRGSPATARSGRHAAKPKVLISTQGRGHRRRPHPSHYSEDAARPTR